MIAAKIRPPERRFQEPAPGRTFPEALMTERADRTQRTAASRETALLLGGVGHGRRTQGPAPVPASRRDQKDAQRRQVAPRRDRHLGLRLVFFFFGFFFFFLEAFEDLLDFELAERAPADFRRPGEFRRFEEPFRDSAHFLSASVGLSG